MSICEFTYAVVEQFLYDRQRATVVTTTLFFPKTTDSFLEHLSSVFLDVINTMIQFVP